MSMLELFTALRSRPRSSSVRGLTADDASVLNDYDLLPSGRKGGLMVKLCVHQPVFVLYGTLVPSGLRNPRHIPASDEHE